MTLGERLKELRTERDLTLEDVGNVVGLQKQAIWKYENGNVSNMKRTTIKKLSDFFNVSPSYLMGYTDERNELELVNPTVTSDTVLFPVIGDIAAGYDNIAVENWSGDTVEIPSSFLKGRKQEEYFVLQVKGDSMYPHYMNGDKVLILKQSTLNNSGDVGAILYDGDNATLKKVEYINGEDWLKLVPINPEYKPKLIEGEDLEQCRILGIPKLVIREL